MNLSNLQNGQDYTNHDIVEIFKCGNMGGMRRSKQTNSLVLIAKYDQCYRSHDWDEQNRILNFMGMGKTGDQSLDYAQNKTLAESKDSSISVHLFESFKPGLYRYAGEVELAGKPFTAIEPDQNGQSRTVIKFPLRLKAST